MFNPVTIGLLFVLLALVVYTISNPGRLNFYNHFVWQAEAFLDGRAAITYPVRDGPFVNAYFNDVMPHPELPGFGLIPFPPLPALLLLPFVAVFGLATDAALFAVALGAINVGLCWWVLDMLSHRRGAAALATLFFAFGTVHWYAAMLGSTWFLAHVVALFFLLLAIGVAIGAERRDRLRPRPTFAALRHAPGLIDWRQFGAGLLFGLAGAARLPVLLGAPFFMLVGGGGSFWRRSVSAGLGAFIPFGLLLIYNFATTGHLLHPAYEWLYQHEYLPAPELINRDWAIEDPRYIPQNALLMLAWPPVVQPECGFELLARECALVRPDQLGMSLLLTSPAYLLALPIVIADWRRRLVAGAALAVLAIAVFNLMHFSQGWVQFGYRFSNDFAPFAVLLVALGIARVGVNWLTVALVAMAIVVNAWGVYWGVTLGW
ncbi:MAG TPA: hypothetical protein VNW68_05740 [Candidatus Limnocylindria bacterium]|nr:hypothetical protein [Candidatus Limnocylindria bacterium]